MISESLSGYQITHRVLRHDLREGLLDAVESGPAAASGVGSVGCRATAALYALLLEHPVDRRGRCASCGWAGVVVGRRRRCRIYRVAHHWLHQPSAALASGFASELGLSVAPLPVVVGPGPDWPCLTITGRAEQDDTDVIPRVETESPTSDAEFPPVPVSSPPSSSDGDFSEAGWPGSDHGEAEELPDRPRPRRGPPDDDPSPGPRASSALVTEDALCLT